MTRHILIIVAVLLSTVTAMGQRQLIRHEAFVSRLAAEDLSALYAAQDTERRVADLLLRFYESYDTAAGIAAAYSKVNGAATADSLFTRFEAAKKDAGAQAQEIALLWEKVFDNKTFAYNYLLDVSGQRAVLSKMEQAGRDASDEIARRLDGEESEHVLEYLEQKSLVFIYERKLAELLDAKEAADSLARAQTVFDMLKRPLPRLELEERSFIEYESAKVYSPAKYNAKNPIPQVAEYKNGIVYRVRLGSYTVKQAVGIFKGVYPLGWKQNGKMWEYYAGGYEDLAAAEKALADMKKRGFTKAILAVWNDGTMTVLGTGRFRVEIVGEDLSEEVRKAIGAAEVIRQQDGVFTAGLFTNGLDAERVAAAIRKADAELEVRIVDAMN